MYLATTLKGIKSFFRGIRKNRNLFVLSIFGMATTLAAYLYISAYTIHESSFDKHHTNYNALFRVDWYSKDVNSGEVRTQSARSFQGISRLKSELTGIKEAVGLFPTQGIITYGEDSFNEERIFFASSDYLKVFKNQLKEGSPSDLDKPGAVFLSECMVQKYFGNVSAIGKRIAFRDIGFGGVVYELEVLGILYDSPTNTHLKVNMLVSMSDLERESKIILGNIPDLEWRWAAFCNYFELEPGTDPSVVQQGLNNYITRARERYDQNSQTNTNLTLQPIGEIYLKSTLTGELEPGGNGKVLRYLTLVGLCVLVLGWLNYINLTTASLIGRAKEVGVKKLMGSGKTLIILQTLLETVMVNIIALLVAGVLLYTFHQYFTSMIGKDIFTTWSIYMPYIVTFLIGFIICSLLTGIYPALVLAGFDPKLIMKGAFKNTDKGKWLRKGMVGLQYVVVISLLSNLGIFVYQVKHMQSIDLGVEVDRKLILQVPWRDNRDSTYVSVYTSFENELKSLSFVRDVTASSIIPGREVIWRTGANRQADGNKAADVYRLNVSDNFFNAYGIDIKYGRLLNPAATHEIVVNERTLELFDMKNDSTSLHETIIFHNGDTMRVVGIVSDFYQRSPQYEMLPLAFQYSRTGGSYVSVLYEGDIGQAQLTQVEQIYKSTFPGFPFQYTYLRDDFDRQYESDKRFASIFTAFSILAIIISIIGLIGLAAYLANSRAKEFSIRKTLGATSAQLFVKSLRFFGIMLLISMIVALPLSYVSAMSWLQNYASRISINVVVFLLPVLAIAVITLLAVARQSYLIATENPIKNLRSE